MTRTRWRQDNEALLRALTDAEYPFAIIGGVAAVLHGATRMTIDLVVVGAFDEGSLGRLLHALRPHAPVHATRPDLSLLAEPMARLQTFRMLLNQLDLVEMIVHGIVVRVLSRPQLIAVKRAAGRRKDFEVVTELEALQKRDEEG